MKNKLDIKKTLIGAEIELKKQNIENDFNKNNDFNNNLQNETEFDKIPSDLCEM